MARYVPVGTAPRIRDSSTSSRPPGTPVAWNPEFLRESFAIEVTLRPDRLVLGFNVERSWTEAVPRQCFEKIVEAGT